METMKTISTIFITKYKINYKQFIYNTKFFITIETKIKKY